MAYQIEDIFKEFNEAMEVYSNAMEATKQSYAQLQAAQRKLQAVYEEFLNFMGEQEFSAEPGPDLSASLLGRFSGITKDFGSFFDIGGLF